MTLKTAAALLVTLSLATGAVAAPRADSAAAMYNRALARERVLRDASSKATVEQLRALARSYENVVLRHPVSGYCDNALWQGSQIALLAYQRSGQAADKQLAARLLKILRDQYPSSSLVPRVDAALREIDAPRPAPAAASVSPNPAPPAIAPLPTPASPPRPPAVSADRAPKPEKTAPPAPALVTILDVKRTSIPDGVRLTIEMDGEAPYRSERIEGPARVFFDLKGVQPVPKLRDSTLKFHEDVVREVRLGRHPQNTTRVAIDLDGVESYSAFTLYDPFRLIVDFKTAATAGTRPSAPPLTTLPPAPPAMPLQVAAESASPPEAPAAVAVTSQPIVTSPIEPRPLPSRALDPAVLASPTAPSANSDGKFSIARQLGLGVSRIVIDAGHGGHDPGAQANGINESELVLDVAQRVAKLIRKETNIEVVMTRDSDVFIPLEERTAIANREGADLFLSIHANASRNKTAHGVETYFLNFASNPEAEAVAARENSASGRTMHSLPDIVKAIALNNKIDESRDFADMVQRSMVKRLSTKNVQLKDLGVKQAPFVVLIGAGMPSVLAEISFVTHRQEGQLLKSGAYRQQIAQALYDAVIRYQQSLKKGKSAGAQIGPR